MHEQTQIWSLYRITNKINGKVYIGQAADLSKRWSDHRRAVRLNKPTQIIHHAMIKHGIENFEFEVIASCKSQNDANETETILVAQYDSFIRNDKGYNATLGGMNAPKSEEWIRAMKEWHASLSPEKRAEISRKQSVSFTKYIKENGHIALGTKRTDEQRANISAALKALDKEAIYTEEVRQHMSDAHIGLKDTEETKQRKSDSIKEAWAERIDYSRKCEAPGCEVSGKAKYKIIDGIRYCNMHGLRMLRNGILEKLPPFKYTEDNPMPEDVRAKCGASNIGRIPHNRKEFTAEQIDMIIADPRSSRKIAKELGVTEKVIVRIRKQNKQVA